MIEVVAVRNARVIIHFPTDELNPSGRPRAGYYCRVG